MTFRYYDGYSPFVIVLNMMVLKLLALIFSEQLTFGNMLNMMILKFVKDNLELAKTF